MTDPSSQNDDPELQKIYSALVRAGQIARDKARETGVPLVFWKDDKVVYEYVPKDEPSADVASPNDSQSQL